MPEDPAAPYHRLASTPWLDPARTGLTAVLAEVDRFSRRTWRLPSGVPASCAHHALSPRLPARAPLVRLVRALAGRLVVVNYSPVAAASRPEAALLRGLARALFRGLPPAPWTAAPRGESARWPADSRRAYEASLAAEWVGAHPETARLLGRARRVAVALYEASSGVVASAGAGEAPGTAQPAAIEFVATTAYRLALHVDAGPGSATPSWNTADARAAGAELPPGRSWFAGQVLMPDAVATDAMDPPSRQRWARVTGRLDMADRYWYPESWARFLEPGRLAGCVSAADVLRSRPGQLPGATRPTGRAARLGTVGPGVERGLCVPPGYCLLDCLGTIAVTLVGPA